MWPLLSWFVSGASDERTGLYVLICGRSGLTPAPLSPPVRSGVEARRLIRLSTAVRLRAVIHQRVLLPILLYVYGIFSISTVAAVNRPVALCHVSFMLHCLVTIRQMHLKAPDTKAETDCEVREPLVWDRLRKLGEGKISFNNWCWQTLQRSVFISFPIWVILKPK